MLLSRVLECHHYCAQSAMSVAAPKCNARVAVARILPRRRIVARRERAAGTFGMMSDNSMRELLTRSPADRDRAPVPGVAISRLARTSASLESRLGKWKAPEKSIGIARDVVSGALTLRGQAAFGGRDPERLRRGAVHMGSFEAVVKPRGSSPTFTVGAAKDHFCRRASDDSGCGPRNHRDRHSLVVAI